MRKSNNLIQDLKALKSYFRKKNQETQSIVAKLKVAFCVVFVITVFGCVAPTSSNDQRKESFEIYRKEFQADEETTIRAVYYTLAFASDCKSIYLNPTTGKLDVTYGNTRQYKLGLCVAIDSRGYLLTAGHVLDNFPYVIGNFPDGLKVKRARLIYKSDTNQTKCDFAVIKIEEVLPWPLPIAEAPKIGDLVFGILFNRGDSDFGGERVFAAGHVQVANVLGSLKDGSLIVSSLPIREGDSGGPMLTPTGQLIAINQGWNFTLDGVSGKYERLSVRPNIQIIAKAIETDLDSKYR